MLLTISITLIVLISIIVVYTTHMKRNQISTMAGTIISMTNSMMASIALGIILGINAKDMDLTSPIIVSVSIGMIAGYVTGRPISLLASLEGIMAGIMGGMMGAMLGVMLQPNSAQLMMAFLDVIYILVTALLLRVIDQEIKTKKNDHSKKTFIG
jgi:ribose/xylose/arabinose/galactoside ABC-type transport system permease subunit